MHPLLQSRTFPLRPPLALLLALALACGSTSDPQVDASSSTPPPGPIPYQVAPPAGKLPLPQHDPAFGRADYERMCERLFLLNNFGMYQGANDGTGLMYLHNGLDFYLPNGTPIYAVKAGKVVQIDTAIPSYHHIVVEDAEDPQLAWQYAHVTGFTARVGDGIQQGQRLGAVSFEGLQHIHLNRLVRADGNPWLKGATLTLDSQDRFAIPDTEPPTLGSALQVLSTATGKILCQGAPAQGKVHLITAIRDGGERAHGAVANFAAYGDRLAPRRVRMTLGPMGGPALLVRETDLSLLQLPYAAGSDLNRELTLRLFVPPGLAQAEPSRNGDRAFLSFILTQLPEVKAPTALERTQPGEAWDTAALKADGSPQFADGLYEVKVEAWDGAGNVARRTHVVEVGNASKR